MSDIGLIVTLTAIAAVFGLLGGVALLVALRALGIAKHLEDQNMRRMGPRAAAVLHPDEHRYNPNGAPRGAA